MLGVTLTDSELWEKLSSFVNDETSADNDDNNNDNNNNSDELARLGDRHCADHCSTTMTTLLGKRHSADEDRLPCAVTPTKRHCVDTGQQHCAAGELTVEPTLLGERHSAECRGVNVLGAVASNTSLRTVYRSLCRAVVSNLRSMSPASDQLTGLTSIVASGGALLRNSVMMKAVTDLYKLPLVINAVSDTADSAVGAAIAAERFL